MKRTKIIRLMLISETDKKALEFLLFSCPGRKNAASISLPNFSEGRTDSSYVKMIPRKKIEITDEYMTFSYDNLTLTIMWNEKVRLVFSAPDFPLPSGGNGIKGEVIITSEGRADGMIFTSHRATEVGGENTRTLFEISELEENSDSQSPNPAFTSVLKAGKHSLKSSYFLNAEGSSYSVASELC